MRHAFLLFLAVVLLEGAARPATAPAGDVLKLLISVEQTAITAPYPARLTLHLYNAGPQPLWVYRRVRGQATEGSSAEARFEPIGAPGPAEITAPAQSKFFESVGLPRPRLVRVAPGEDYTEKASLEIAPARRGAKGEGSPLWGRYRLSVTYRAKYSNAEDIQRLLGVVLWQGEVTSNTIELELQPPAGEGSIAGTVLDVQGRAFSGALATLSDQEDRLVNQVLTDLEGRFSFAHLPFGDYWVTARRPEATEDTVVFRHLRLASTEPTSTLELVMLPREIYEPQYLLHKPVLFRVTDSAGHPLDKVSLEAVWSSGTVLDNVKGQVFDDGTVALELIPGRNFVTLKRRGCPKEDHRADVALGAGIDGFKLTSECAEKR
jgi:hypothetical protein